MSESKIESLNIKPDEMKASIERMTRMMPELLSHAALTAKIKRGYYSALIEQGFSADQALVLCQSSMTI